LRTRLKALYHGSGEVLDFSARVRIVLRVITRGNFGGRSDTEPGFSKALLSFPVHIILTVIRTHISAIYSRHYISLAICSAFGLKKVKVNFSRYRPVVAQRLGKGLALLFHDHGTRRVGVVSLTPRPLFTPEKDPITIVQEAGWAPGPVWTSAENLAPPGFDPRTA
jgi:hypothetical protein